MKPVEKSNNHLLKFIPFKDLSKVLLSVPKLLCNCWRAEEFQIGWCCVCSEFSCSEFSRTGEV